VDALEKENCISADVNRALGRYSKSLLMRSLDALDKKEDDADDLEDVGNSTEDYWSIQKKFESLNIDPDLEIIPAM